MNILISCGMRCRESLHGFWTGEWDTSVKRMIWSCRTEWAEAMRKDCLKRGPICIGVSALLWIE